MLNVITTDGLYYVAVTRNGEFVLKGRRKRPFAQQIYFKKPLDRDAIPLCCMLLRKELTKLGTGLRAKATDCATFSPKVEHNVAGLTYYTWR